MILSIGRPDLYGEYCDAEIEMLKSPCESTDWFIDIGANIGYIHNGYESLYIPCTILPSLMLIILIY